jgi:uncharacterized protein YdeI (BOF family)/uncharacterized lipoprotein YehR (DUF1307 family)
MKKYFKFIFTFLVAVSLVLGLTACGDSDQDKVDKAFDTLEIQYTTPDTMNGVTKDLVLRTSIGEVSIEWASSDAQVVSTSGKVTRPAASAGDKLVTLTATLSLGKAEKAKEFKVKVLKQVDYFAELAALEIGGAQKEGNLYVTTSDITLPTTVADQTVVWTSADPEVISNTGKVTRPEFGQPDKVVTLIASAGGEQATFLVKVLALAEEPQEDILAQAKDALLIPGISNGVAQNIELPTTVGQKGVTVTWTSSNPDVIDGQGVVTRGDVDITVTLTAILHLEGYTGTPVTKDFEVVVLAMVQGKPLNSLAEIKDLTANPNKTYVEVKGVTVLGITDEGFMIYDGSLIVFVYDKGTRSALVQEGAVLDIRGETNIYYGAVQLQNSDSAAKPIVVKESTADAQYPTPTVVDNIETFLTGKPTEYNDTTTFNFEYITLTAYVRHYSDDNYDTVLVDDPTYRLKTAANTPHDGKGFVVYYHSNNKDLQPYDKVKVTINAFFYAYRTDRKVFTIIYTGGAQDIVFGGTEEEKLGVIQAVAESNIAERYTADATINLVTEFLGATIAWSSDNEASINPTTGAVVVPATGEQLVTLTGDITLGTLTKTFTVPVKLGLPDAMTMAAAVAQTNGQVRVKGVVTGYAANDTFAIQDETGGAALYIKDAPDEVKALLADAIGKTVDLLGTRAAYNGLQQIIPLEVIAVTEGTPVTAVDISALTFDEAGLLVHQGKVVSLTRGTVSEFNKDSYGNISFTLTTDDDKVIKFKWDSRTPLLAATQTALEAVKNGDKFDFTGLILGWASNAPLLAPTDTLTMEIPPLSDQEIVNLTETLVRETIKGQYVANETVELPAENQGATIAWVSDNPTLFDAETGEVTIPTAGAPVQVELTVTITKGTATATVVIQTEVGAFEVITVDEAKQELEGRLVKTTGVLTAYANNDVYTLQDETGGVALYIKNASNEVKALLADAIGKTVTVQGSRDTFNGTEQIVVTEVVVGEVAVLPASESLDGVVLDAATLLPLQSKLVDITKVTVSNKQSDTHGNITFTLTTLDGESINFRWDSRVSLPTELVTKLQALVDGDIVTITNAILGWYNNPQLLPAQSMVIADAVLTDAEKIQLASAALVLEFEGKTFAGGSQANLPDAGAQGTTLVWTTDPVDAIVAGNWMEVTVETPVVLTAAITSGTLTETLDLNVTVVVPSTTVLVIASYTGATTTMVANQNNAELIGLDETIFNATTNEASSYNNKIGLNKDGSIRLYANRGDGQGNILTISVLGTQKIKRVKITFGVGKNHVAGETSAEVTLGTAAPVALDSTQVKSVSVEYTDLDITSFAIKNTTTGSESGQLWITGIEIEYLP